MLKQLMVGIVISMSLGVTAVSCTRPIRLPFIAQPVVGVQATPRSSAPGVGADLAVDRQLSTTTTVAPGTTSSVEITTVPATAPAYPPGVLLVGDSILEGLNILSYRFGPNTVYDTEVARSVLRLDSVLADHELPADVVVHLGTNGWLPTTGETLSESLSALSDRRVLLVNLSVDRAYAGLANAELAAIATHHDHVTLVDWNAAATPDLVRADGFHPNLEGYEVLGRLIANALGLPADFALTPPIERPHPSAGSRQQPR